MEFNATLLVSSISFIIFVIIMNQILYKPILAIMQQRKDYIDNNKFAVDEHKKHAKELLDNKDKKIVEANKKSRDIVAATVESLKEEESRMLGNTRAEMNSYFNDKKRIIADEKNNTVNNLAFNVADIANNITTKLVGYGVAFDPLSEDEVKEVIRKNA